MKSSIHTDLDAFHSGFQACAKEVMQYLNKVENWTTREQRCAHLINHLHKVSAQFQPAAPFLSQLAAGEAKERDIQKADGQANCVPVIQRTQTGELNETDTDTDSGYGGEPDKNENKLDQGCEHSKAQASKAVKIKQEFGDDRAAKKPKMNWGGAVVAGADASTRPDLAFINSLMGIAGGIGQQTPFCMPFYFINPSAAASYVPLFDKGNLEKYVYPAAAALTSPFPWLYPGLPAHTAAAAAASFPGLSTEKGSRFGSSSHANDSPSHDSDASNEAESGSPEQREESQDGDGEGDDSQDNDNDGT